MWNNSENSEYLIFRNRIGVGNHGVADIHNNKK